MKNEKLCLQFLIHFPLGLRVVAWFVVGRWLGWIEGNEERGGSDGLIDTCKDTELGRERKRLGERDVEWQKQNKTLR